MKAKRVLVVGVCTAGKSTLVKALRDLGWSAYGVAQEHSSVPGLWKLRSPDVVIYLDVSYEKARLRRRISWGESRLDVQREKLAQARSHAQVVLDTSDMTCEEVLEQVLLFLAEGGDEGWRC